jgi:hypothetical protein
MQARKLASPFDWAELASIRSACRIATMSPPKQMDPNEVVMVRRKLLLMADPQHPDSDGSYHHVPTVPATITWMEYCTKESPGGKGNDMQAKSLKTKSQRRQLRASHKN